MLNRSLNSAIAISFLILLGPGLQAAPKKSETLVKTAVNAGKVGDDGKQVIAVELTIEDTWHLYANPVQNKDLVESQVVLTASAGGKPISAKVTYPEGKFVKDADVGNYYIYEGKITIKATVDRGKLGSAPIDLKITVQACNSNQCLPPGDIKLQVP